MELRWVERKKYSHIEANGDGDERNIYVDVRVLQFRLSERDVWKDVPVAKEDE